MRIEKASLTSVLRGMERRGLVKRARNDDDRRCAVLTLTTKGCRLQKKLSGRASRVNRRATQGFTKDHVSTLRRLLAQTITNLEA